MTAGKPTPDLAALVERMLEADTAECQADEALAVAKTAALAAQESQHAATAAVEKALIAAGIGYDTVVVTLADGRKYELWMEEGLGMNLISDEDVPPLREC